MKTRSKSNRDARDSHRTIHDFIFPNATTTTTSQNMPPRGRPRGSTRAASRSSLTPAPGGNNNDNANGSPSQQQRQDPTLRRTPGSVRMSPGPSTFSSSYGSPAPLPSTRSFVAGRSAVSALGSALQTVQEANQQDRDKTTTARPPPRAAAAGGGNKRAVPQKTAAAAAAPSRANSAAPNRGGGDDDGDDAGFIDDGDDAGDSRVMPPPPRPNSSKCCVFAIRAKRKSKQWLTGEHSRTQQEGSLYPARQPQGCYAISTGQSTGFRAPFR